MAEWYRQQTLKICQLHNFQREVIYFLTKDRGKTLSTFDSTAETLKHIRRVSQLLNQACIELLKRANRHDESKLHNPEKELFDEMTPLLKNMVFGSPEYTESVKKLKPALDHHYAFNSHHPQYYSNGINGMSLFDLVEMFFDWKAAGERGKDGDIYKSIEIQADRFGLSKQLKEIFKNTADMLPQIEGNI